MVEDYPLAVSAYSVCDVVMVNRVADGLRRVLREKRPQELAPPCWRRFRPAPAHGAVEG
jgi:hypothetical protein